MADPKTQEKIDQIKNPNPHPNTKTVISDNQRIADLEAMLERVQNDVAVIMQRPKMKDDVHPLGIPVELLNPDDTKVARDIFMTALQAGIIGRVMSSPATVSLNPAMLAKHCDSVLIFAEEITKRWLERKNLSRQQATQTKAASA